MSKPLSDPIKNSLLTFSPPKFPKKNHSKMSDVRTYASPFERPFIANQVHDGDPDVLYSHENHPYPPSPSHFGELSLE